MKSTMQLLVRGTLWLSIGGLSLGHAVAQHRKNDLEHERLKGRVKMLKTERARLVKESGKWIEKDKVTLELVSFDKEARIAQTTIYSRGFPPAVMTYSFDKDGTRHGLPHVNPRLGQFLGGQQTELDYSAGSKCAFGYDDRGNRTQDSCRVTDSKVVFEHRFEYDERDRRTVDAYSRAGVLVSRKTYTYDENGNVTAMSQHDGTGKLLDRQYYSYEFDATGNWIKRRTSKFVGSDGNYSYEPVEVYYRTIVYY